MSKQNKEMINWYIKRTTNHIKLVHKYADEIIKYDSRFLDMKESVKNHDIDKLKKLLIVPYVIITWKYKCDRDSVDFEIPDNYKDETAKATITHIKNNPHHPEYHDDNFNEDMFNKDDRDGVPNEMVDATRMPLMDVAEMVADWFAVAEEKNTEPRKWADMNVNERWKFTKEQVDLIYELIENVWEKK